MSDTVYRLIGPARNRLVTVHPSARQGMGQVTHDTAEQLKKLGWTKYAGTAQEDNGWLKPGTDPELKHPIGQDTMAVRMCTCGSAMAQDANNIWTCDHCDGPCHHSCASDAPCGQGGQKCAGCTGLSIGTRKKRDASWVPPKMD